MGVLIRSSFGPAGRDLAAILNARKILCGRPGIPIRAAIPALQAATPNLPFA
jgi:hypothetical protein